MFLSVQHASVLSFPGYLRWERGRERERGKEGGKGGREGGRREGEREREMIIKSEWPIHVVLQPTLPEEQLQRFPKLKIPF